MIKKKYLYRHFKICKHVNVKTKKRNQALVDGQNIMLKFTNSDDQLVEKVFPRMTADQISFIAKSDNLIKAFGSGYLKCHKEKH